MREQPRAETVGSLLRTAEVARAARLALSTQCGFASVPGNNPVSAHGQRAKLELVARIAQRTWPL